MPYIYPVLHVEPYHERPVWIKSMTEVDEYIPLLPLAGEREVELFLGWDMIPGRRLPTKASRRTSGRIIFPLNFLIRNR